MVPSDEVSHETYSKIQRDREMMKSSSSRWTLHNTQHDSSSHHHLSSKKKEEEEELHGIFLMWWWMHHKRKDTHTHAYARCDVWRSSQSPQLLLNWSRTKVKQTKLGSKKEEGEEGGWREMWERHVATISSQLVQEGEKEPYTTTFFTYSIQFISSSSLTLSLSSETFFSLTLLTSVLSHRLLCYSSVYHML